MAQPPPPSEAGDGGEGRRGEAHHHVGQGHVAHKQVDTGVEAGGPRKQHFIIIFFIKEH